jgi:hypothetical protein
MDMQAYLVIDFQSWRLLEANSKHWIDYVLEWGHINYSSHTNTAECKKIKFKLHYGVCLHACYKLQPIT